MSSYSQATKQLGDLWVDSLKRAEEAVARSTKTRTEARAPVRRTTTGLRQELPSLHEVVQANFELAERVLKAQKHYALKAIEAAFPESAKSTRVTHHEPRKPAAPRRKARTTRARPKATA